MKEKQKPTRCVMCGKHTLIKTTVPMMDRDPENDLIVMKSFPCEQCKNCGEEFYSPQVAEEIRVLTNRNFHR